MSKFRTISIFKMVAVWAKPWHKWKMGVSELLGLTSYITQRKG